MIDYIVLDVKFRWEDDLRLILLFPNDSFRLEPLQMQDQNLWSLVNGDLFCGQLMVLTVRTVPLVPRF